MPVNTCPCGVRFAIGLMRCPRCKTVAPQYAASVKEEEMPRITVTDGPSNAGSAPGEVGYIEHERTEAAEAVGEIRSDHAPEPETKPGHLVLRDYESMTLVELRAAAKEQGLPTSGAKADLLARLARGGVAEAAPEAEAATVEQEVSE